MPAKPRVGKQRTVSGAKKRFKLTGSGKYKMQKVARNHLLQQKPKRAKRLARKALIAHGTHLKALKRMMPNG